MGLKKGVGIDLFGMHSSIYLFYLSCLGLDLDLGFGYTHILYGPEPHVFSLLSVSATHNAADRGRKARN
jgi:hypothetical protein